MHNKLQEILKVKLEEIKSIDLENIPQRLEKSTGFRALVEKRADISIIAEIKKASPSKGIIRQDFNLIEIIKEYIKLDLQAISVLTDEQFFKGSLSYLTAVKKETDIPVLRKDFIIDEKQVYESFHYGADMILLIVAMLDSASLSRLHETAKSLGLEVLVETHTQDEITRAVDAGAEIIGINNRDLNTFQVDLNTSLNLVSKIPGDIIKVAESGMHSFEDIQAISQAGFDAVLVGEAFMKSNNISATFSRLFKQ